jgi:ABC-type oligopeptide transport system substrate-binding subunit
MQRKTVLRIIGGAVVVLLLIVGYNAISGDRNKGNHVTVNVGEPEQLITTFANEGQGVNVLRSLYKGLVDYDPVTRKPLNMVAENISSTDSVTWHITIKPGWTFHNGEKVDADSFIRAWNYGAYGPHAQDNNHFYDRIAGYEDLQAVDPDGDGPKEAPAPKAQALTGLHKLGELAFDVVLKAPFSQFATMLGFNAFFPMAKACFDDLKACNEKPIGEGPFKMKGAWEHNKQIRVVRNESYPGPKPKLDEITFRIYDKIDTAYLDLLGGELDVLTSVPPAKFEEAKAKFGDRIIQQRSADLNFISIPYYLTDYQNPKMRQALSLAIDRQPIIDALFDGQYTPAKSVISPVVPGYRADACSYCEFDPARAKRLMQEAGGWPAGKKIQLWCNSGQGHDKWLQAVGDQLQRNLGIPYALHCELQMAQYLHTLDERQMTGPFRLRWTMDYPAAENYLKPMYTFEAPGNFEEYQNSKVDQLVAQGDRQLDPDDALPYYQRAEDIVLQDMPIIPLWFGMTSIVMGDRIATLKYNPAQYIDWSSISVKE